MTDNLSFPDLVMKWKEPKPALEICIDYLPEEYRYKWDDELQQAVARWVKKKKFKRKATIWIWGTMSTNFLSKNGTLAWSEFVIEGGFGEDFLQELQMTLDTKFKGQTKISEMVVPTRDDGWKAICHVEQGRAWEEVDPGEWSAISGK